MARLPNPEMEKIQVSNPEDVEEVAKRMKTFYSTLKQAISKAELDEKRKRKEG